MSKDPIKSSTLRFSIRVAKRVTSISLRKNIISLWILLKETELSEITKDSVNNAVSDFIYDSLNDWNNNNGKGLSDFISERMIQEILEEDDFMTYREISVLI